MYSVICTGKNKNYGKAGERKLIANARLKYCLREGVIIKPRYAGSGIMVITTIDKKG